MMPLTEIRRLAQTVTDSRRSPVADQVAAAWGCPAGAARWWRSSASHVFVITRDDGRRFLRMVPGTYRGQDGVASVVRLMAELSRTGSAVVRPVAAESGSLTMSVPTELGVMHAMVVEAAPGDQVDVDDLTEQRARSWGQALARLHGDAAGLRAGLSGSFGELAEVAGLFAADTPLTAATRTLSDWTGRLPRDEARWGVVHGDFELDNMAWAAGQPVAYDFDEAAVSWFAADIAFAVRDLADASGQIAAEYQASFDAFIAGYRSLRPLGDQDLASLPLFAGLHAAVTLVRIARALGEPGRDEPGWLAQLRAKLAGRSRALRQLVISSAAHAH